MNLVRGELAKSAGWRSLWRGVSPTLWRDVPFSAIYWTCYELEKKAILARNAASGVNWHVGFTSFVCGASSGVIAAVLDRKSTRLNSSHT